MDAPQGKKTRRRARRRAESGGRRLARRAEEIERALRVFEAEQTRDPAARGPNALDRDALSRLETSLAAAAAAARRLAERSAPEHGSFTERRADEDWTSTAARRGAKRHEATKTIVADEESADLAEF